MKIRFDLPPTASQESNGMAVRYAAAKRQVPRWRWHLLLALVLLPPLYFVARFAAAYWWETAPGFVLMPDAVVKAGASGRIATLLPKGSSVTQGQPLGQLAAPATEPAVEPAPTSPVTAGAGPDDTPRLGARRDAAREALRLAREQLALREQRRSVVQRLLQQGAATAGELASAQAQVLAARADLVKARLDLDELSQRPARTPPAPAATVVAPAVPAPPLLAIAPLDGELVHLFAQRGDWVGPDSEVGLVRGRGEPRIMAYVDPAEVRYARIGRRATLRFADGTSLKASVAAVAPEAQRLPPERVSPLAPRGQSIVVELRPDQPLPPRYRVHYTPLDVRFEHVGFWSE